MEISEKVRSLKKKLHKLSTKGLALDIDETLCWTIGYWAEELNKLCGNPENLSIKDLIKKYKHSDNVPHWQTKEGKSWIEKAICSNELQVKLPLIEDADLMVKKIDKIVPVVAYITSRPEMITKGTKEWLKKYKFPEAEIIARPRNVSISDGNKWKAHVLEYLYPEVVGIIDDNPKLISFLNDYPGKVYLYNNSDNLQKESNLVPCQTWKDVFKEVENGLMA